MQVDQAGNQRVSGQIDKLISLIAADGVAARQDVDDGALIHRDAMMFKYDPLRLDRDQPAWMNEKIDRRAQKDSGCWVWDGSEDGNESTDVSR
ncbi:hypothetical protein FACS1894154_07300 [Betaproteobacteria bacterium]|nr:hypothetical protein FACS1894154_07300 [Betaproteobacteria bacterium]